MLVEVEVGNEELEDEDEDEEDELLDELPLLLLVDELVEVGLEEEELVVEVTADGQVP